MGKLDLIAHTQGIRGAKAKSTPVGYSMLESRKNGQPVCNIMVDTFQGQGETYQEREDLLVVISFGAKSFTMSPKQLQSILEKHFKKLK